MFDGFYRIAFTGSAGSGFGMLVFRDGIVSGADVSGAIYEGTYIENENGESIDFQGRMNAPVGVIPVQTGKVLEEPLSMPLSGAIALSRVEKNQPSRLQTPMGPVNVIFQKLKSI